MARSKEISIGNRVKVNRYASFGGQKGQVKAFSEENATGNMMALVKFESENRIEWLRLSTLKRVKAS